METETDFIKSMSRVSAGHCSNARLFMWVITWLCYYIGACFIQVVESAVQVYNLTGHVSATLKHSHKNIFIQARLGKRLLGIEAAQIQTQLASNGTQQIKTRRWGCRSKSLQ